MNYRCCAFGLALMMAGCAKSATAPARVRDLILGGEITIRSRTYLLDWVEIDLNDRLVGYLGAEDAGRTALTVIFAKTTFSEENARINSGVFELSALVQPHDFYFLKGLGFPRYPPTSEFYSDDGSYVTVLDRTTREVLGTRRLESRTMVINEPGTLKWTVIVDANGVVR